MKLWSRVETAGTLRRRKSSPENLLRSATVRGVFLTVSVWKGFLQNRIKGSRRYGSRRFLVCTYGSLLALNLKGTNRINVENKQDTIMLAKYRHWVNQLLNNARLNLDMSRSLYEASYGWFRSVLLYAVAKIENMPTVSLLDALGYSVLYSFFAPV